MAGMMFLLLMSAAVDPDVLAERALAQHPSLEAQAAQTRSLEALVPTAGVWMDPMFSVELSNLPLDSGQLSGHGMAGVQLKVSQTLPTPGAIPLQESLAGERAHLAALREQESELQLRVAVHQAAWGLALLAELEAITAAHVDAVSELQGSAQARYEAGQGGQSALLRLELLRSRLEDEGFTLQQRRLALRSELEALVGPLEGAMEMPAAALGLPPLPDAAQWERPALQAWEAQEALARQQAELARVQARPQPTVWAGYRVRNQPADGVDLASLGVSMPLPNGSRKKAQGVEQSALEQAAAASSQRAALELEIQAQAQAALARWEAAAERARRFDQELLPQAALVLETTRGDYAVGRASFTDLYEAQVALLELERARAAAVVETWRQRASLAGATGLWTEL